MTFLASPGAVVPPDAALAPWAALQHTWTDYNGTEWDLSQGLSGLALAPGFRGMGMPTIVRYATKAPAVAGSLWRGSVTDEREVMWPLRVFSTAGSQSWLDHNRRFWQTMNPDHTGVWKVTQPSGATRSLTVRFASSDEDNAEGGELFGWSIYSISLIAEDPYWRGEQVSRQFYAEAGETYYGGDAGGGFGPPYFTGVGNTTDSATITNDGDVSAWPTWTVHGPTTNVTVGLSGRIITFPMTLTDGQYVRIDTHPTDQVAIDHSGSERQLGTVEFAEIPPGANVPLSIVMVGTGSVEVSIRPPYYLGA